MSTSEVKLLCQSDKNTFFSIHFMLLKLVLIAAVALCLEKPVGSISGHVALEKFGFQLYSSDLRQNKVYAVARGPRGDETIERGAWVQADGSFQIASLPIGEYALKVRAQGFTTKSLSSIFVEDGKITELPSVICMHVLSPSVNVASNTRVFTSQEKPHFWINAIGGTHAKVRLYRQDLCDLLAKNFSWTSDDLDLSSDLQIYKSSKKVVNFITKKQPIRSLSRELTLDDQDSARAEFILDKSLPPGDYFVVAELSNLKGESDRNLTWFSVTDIGLVVKQAPDRTLVRALDLNSLKPRAQVSVELLIRDGAKLTNWSAGGITGADGFVSLPSVANVSNKNLIVYGHGGNEHAVGSLWMWRNANDSWRTYFYTDKPIYRLGQTVCYKAIARKQIADGYTTPKAGTLVHAVLEDPDNNELWHGDVRTNDHGTFHGTLDIPADGKTGAYQLTFTYPDGAIDYERFEIAQYRKPEYQVTVTPTMPRVTAGTKITARVHAEYYFGAPVKDARVKYTVYASTDWASRYSLMRRPAYCGYFDGWSDDDSSDYYETSGDFVTEGYAQTDENGDALIQFNSQPIEADHTRPFGSQYIDKRYKIEAEVTDLSRMSVIAAGHISVSAGDFAILIQPKVYVLKAGEPVSVDFTAVDYDRKPIANQAMTLKLVRWPYDIVKHEYRALETENMYRVTTGSDGQGHISFKTDSRVSTDSYFVTGEAVDRQGHIVYDEESIWIANSSAPYQLSQQEAEQEPLQIKLDKKVYRPGDKAKVMISGPFNGKAGTDALVTIEGLKLYDYKVVPLTATATMVEIPIERAYEPNVYIGVCTVGKKHQFYQQTKLLKVAPQEHFLNIAITCDKAKYKPGEKVTYKIQADYPNGTPAPDTELSLAVVDESIYGVRPETAEDIQKFWYSQRPNWVNTISSFPEQYSGGPDKIEPRMRKDFRDTAAWIPILKTDQNGIAVATVTLPDNLTTWRATIRGINTAVDVGSAVNKVISTQDLILRLALPRFFRQGDKGLITAIVHNYTDKEQTVNVSLKTSCELSLIKPLSQSYAIAPQKAQRYQWPIGLVSSGMATVAAEAIGQTAADALERKIPVHPLGIPAFATASAVLAKDLAQAEIPLGLPSDAAAETAQCTLSLSPSTIGPVLGNFNSLIDYPYGCTEQTMSRLMPSLVAMQLHRDLGVPISAVDQAKFQKVYELSMQKLKQYQHGDGGWGWWENDDTSMYLTAHVVQGMHLLSQCGWVTDRDQINRALAWLKKSLPIVHRQLTDPKLVHNQYMEWESKTDIAQVLYSLSLYRQPLPEYIVSWLQLDRDKLPPEALAFATLACKTTGNNAAAQAFFRRLESIANRTGYTMDWDHTEGLIKRFQTSRASRPFTGTDYTYRFTGAETTALALRAVVSMEPDNSRRIEPIKEWLLLQQSKDGWGNTKTTSQVFVALLEEELACRARGGAQMSFAAAVGLAGQALKNFNFNLSNLYSPAEKLFLPLTKAVHTLTLSKTGPGRLYCNLLSTYFRHLSPGDQISEKSYPSGIKLEREFCRLEAQRPDASGAIHFASKPITNHSAKAGETALMKVCVNAPIALPYVIVEATLPSGAEVVDDPSKQDLIDNDSGEQQPFMLGDWGSRWWTHQDTLDDRIVFFVTNLPAGKHEFHALVRLEQPGRFQLNPMSIAGMYTSKIHGYSKPDYIQVDE